ncbi:MAG TPA: DUF3325 domain-containing protein [Gammaproteobacteria bacterium]
MADAAVLTLAFLAAACAAFRMERHQRSVFERPAAAGWRRAFGAGAIGAAGAACVVAVATHGPAIGVVQWMWVLGLAAVAVGLVLSYRPRCLPWLAALAAFAAALTGAAA